MTEHIQRAHVEACIARKTLRLRFPPALEAFFEQETGEQRCRELLRTGVFGLLILQLLLPPLWLMIGDIFPQVLEVQLGIMTPLILAELCLLLRRPSPFVREMYVIILTMTAVVTYVYLGVTSRSPDRWVVPQMFTLGFLYVTAMQRLRFLPAAIACVGMVLLDMVIMAGMPQYDTRAYFACVSLFLGATVFALYGTWQSERQMRLAYLLSLLARLQNRELDRLSNRDPLTGLGNRRLLAAAKARCRRNRAEALSVILIDIDHFKRLNDSAGHQAGDTCLARVAALIRAALGERPDQAFRYGGEEFLLLLAGCPQPAAQALAERIRTAIAAAGIPNPGLGPSGRVTVSLGVASQVRGEGVEALVTAADTALYAAKEAGRNRVRVQSGEGAALAARLARAVPVPRRFPEGRRATPPTSRGV